LLLVGRWYTYATDPAISIANMVRGGSQAKLSENAFFSSAQRTALGLEGQKLVSKLGT